MTQQIHYLIVPGWNGSPAQHWQSHWQRSLPNSSRVEQDNWHLPQKSDWVQRLQESIASLPGQVVLIAHSLGCVTVAHWAAQADAASLAKVSAALLVAPADVEREGCPQPLCNFAPVPTQALPFPSMLIGSSNDHAASAQRALEFAHNWGSSTRILPNAGHINIDSGHQRWEQGFAWLYQLQELAITWLRPARLAS